jgi:hypothetical protein
MYSLFLKRISKIGALLAATVVLPTLLHAGTDNGNGNGGINNGKQKGHPVVPEVNPAWVLVPFAGAVLIYSWRRSSRTRESH